MRLAAPISITTVSIAALLGCTASQGSGTQSAGTSTAPVRSAGGSPPATQAPANSVTPAPLPSPPATTPYTLRFDQLGYLPHGERWAVLVSQGAPAPTYRIYDLAAGGFLAASGNAGPRALDTQSRAGTRLTEDLVDLSAIPGPGRYLVVLGDDSQHGPITVGDSVYAGALPALLRFYAAQRCGNVNATSSLHAACHLFASLTNAHSGDGVAVDDNFAASITTGTGPAVDVEGGWHDAGDFLKFVGTTSYTLSVTLLAVRDHGAALAATRASGSKDPLRTELRGGLDWLAKMVGGAELYHQVSGQPDHDVGFRSPEDDTQTPVVSGNVTYDQRPVFRFSAGQGANLLGRSAAAFALGSQVYSDDPPYAASLLALAKKVYALGKTRPAVQNPDPANFYQEDDWQDDMAYGAAILAQVTGTASYAQDALGYARALTASPGTSVGWNSLDALAYLETALAFPAGSAERAEMAALLATLAAPIVATNKAPAGPAAAFRYGLPALGDGSLAESLGAAVVALADYKLNGHTEGLEVARSQLHWLYGQNPFGLSFQVGLGSASPRNLHHALAQAKGIVLTGAIVGGPTSATTLKGDGLPAPPATDAFAAWSTNEVLYEDNMDDYTVNEPAIDFTAGLVYVLGELLEQP